MPLRTHQNVFRSRRLAYGPIGRTSGAIGSFFGCVGRLAEPSERFPEASDEFPEPSDAFPGPLNDLRRYWNGFRMRYLANGGVSDLYSNRYSSSEPAASGRKAGCSVSIKISVSLTTR